MRFDLSRVLSVFFSIPLLLEERLRKLLVTARNLQLGSIEKGVVFGPAALISNPGGSKDAIRVGENSEVHCSMRIAALGGSISIGRNCFLGPGSRVWSAVGIKVGNNVLISHNVEIHDFDSHSVSAAKRRGQNRSIGGQSVSSLDGNVGNGLVVVNDDAWIGFGAIVLKGVNIGCGAIIAAGSVVTNDVAAWTVVAGNPAREVRKLNPEYPEERS